MARFGVAAAIVFLAGLTGYLLATRDRPTSPRSAPGDRSDSFLRTRVAELERRVEILEEREARTPPAVEAGRETVETAVPAARAPTPAPEAGWHQQQEAWVRRVKEAPTSSARVVVLRQAIVQLRNQTSPATSRAFFEEVLRAVDPVSEEGILVRFELGHLARAEGDHARAEEFYRGIEASVPADSKVAADARFQLAWNLKYAGDPAGAERMFRTVAAAEAAEPGTKIAAFYAIAKLRGEAGDAAGVREELERLLEEAKRHPGHEGVAYYVELAKKLLESLG